VFTPRATLPYHWMIWIISEFLLARLPTRRMRATAKD